VSKQVWFDWITISFEKCENTKAVKTRGHILKKYKTIQHTMVKRKRTIITNKG
jgi:hypothetical protein